MSVTVIAPKSGGHADYGIERERIDFCDN
jgi:hypothetical protein